LEAARSSTTDTMPEVENNPARIDALILCGGKGSRLRPAVQDRPKVLAPVGSGRVFLDILLAQLKEIGFRRFILCCGYLHEQVVQFCEERYKEEDFVFSIEEKPLGTGGAIKNAEEWVRGDWFAVFNGDSLCTGDIGSVFGSSAPAECYGGVILIEDRMRDDVGRVIFSEKSRCIKVFNEKGEKNSFWINSGVYFFQRRIFARITAGFRSLEKEILPSLSSENKLYAWPIEGEVFDIGTPERLSDFAGDYSGNRDVAV
jgi:D-glycero-alpha-D-manno-heptose 1-phosphate guanylyltransferase